MNPPADYERFFDLSPDLLCIAGFDGFFKRINPAWEKLLGYRAEELLGQPYADLVHPEDLNATQGEASRLVHGEPTSTFINRYRCKDGSFVWLEWVSYSLPNEKLIYAAAHDVSERQLAEESLKLSHEDLLQTQLQLVQAEKFNSVGRLAAGVAHEVKSPLAVLMMGVDYLSKFLDLPNQPIDPSHQAVLDAMRQAVSRADVIVRGLVDFSAPRKLELQAHDLRKVLEHALSMVRHELLTHRIASETDFSPDIPPISLDETKIEQVFVNLFINAVHAMPDGGKLRVTTRAKKLTAEDPGFWADRFQPGDTVAVIEVLDTGTGMADENLAKVFDPFFTTKPRGKGTGLGLTVSRNIIDMHRGTIDVTNRAGGGVVATVMLKV